MPQLKWSLICSLLLASQITIASQFSPRGDIEQRYGTNLERRITCQPATPDVNEDAVFTDACNENPQNNFNDCFNSLVLYAQDSALSTCGRFYALYNNCLVNNNYSETTCADARTGYVYCSNYTIQAYAYCGCYFALPTQLYNCANVELEVRNRDYFAPAPTSTLLTSAILTGPVAPSSATLSSIPQSVAATAPPAPVFSPRQSSTLLISTAFITSTVITTSCSSGVSSCAATTYSSAFVSESSVWTCGSAGCVIPPSSLPPVTVTGTPIATVVTPSSTSLAVATTATTPKTAAVHVYNPHHRARDPDIDNHVLSRGPHAVPLGVFERERVHDHGGQYGPQLRRGMRCRAEQGGRVCAPDEGEDFFEEIGAVVK
ncbi:MAG: hypothetical protein Q9177_005280, partial [Variospora cf. flavescens]